MTNLDSILKSRDITLPTNVCLVKAMVFPVVMYGCESWTLKKAEHWIIDAFELWCWRRLLRVPWIATRANKSILKEICPGSLLEGLMPKLNWKKKKHYEGLYCSILAWRIPWTEEPGGLMSMGSNRVGHDWHNLAVAAAAWSTIVKIKTDNKWRTSGSKSLIEVGAQ